LDPSSSSNQSNNPSINQSPLDPLPSITQFLQLGSHLHENTNPICGIFPLAGSPQSPFVPTIFNSVLVTSSHIHHRLPCKAESPPSPPHPPSSSPLLFCSAYLPSLPKTNQACTQLSAQSALRYHPPLPPVKGHGHNARRKRLQIRCKSFLVRRCEGYRSDRGEGSTNKPERERILESEMIEPEKKRPSFYLLSRSGFYTSNSPRKAIVSNSQP